MTHDAVLVGCGNRAQAHAAALTDCERFSLHAVCDLDAEKAESTAEAFGVSAWGTDADAVIEAHDPAHVSVVTPPSVRASILDAVLAHEPSSLTFEKPLADSPESTDAVVDVLAGTDANVSVCHQHIYGDELQALGEWTATGELGEIERLVGTTKGGLFEHGTHFIHTVCWLLDDTPDAVRAHADPPEFEGMESETTVLELEFGRTRAFLHLGPDAPDVPANAETFWLEYQLDVVGEAGHGRFVLGDHARAVTPEGVRRTEVKGFDTDGYATRRFYADVAAWLAGEIEEHPAAFPAALVAHRAAERALDSARDGERVALAARSEKGE